MFQYSSKEDITEIILALMKNPSSTMLYMDHLNISLWNSVSTTQDLNNVFSQNSWVFTLYLDDDEFLNKTEDFLRSKISTMKSLSLNSRVYFFVVTNIITYDEAKLYEAYRITDDHSQELIINEIGCYFDTSFKTLTKTFIWERRQDLNGFEFSVVALPHETFTNFQNNVSILNSNFKQKF